MSRRIVFPPEILVLIASNLSQEEDDDCLRIDLHNFRLTSRLFAGIGLEFLNIKKHFYLRKHSLDRLHFLAHSPALSRKFTEIVFIVDVVPEWYSHHFWESHAYAICHTKLAGIGGRIDTLADSWLQKYTLGEHVPLSEIHDPSFKTAGWKFHQKIRHEQEELLNPPSNALKKVRQDLAMLQNLNLNSFSLDTFEGKRHSNLMRPLFTLSRGQDWYCYNSGCSSDSFQMVATSLIHAVLSPTTVDGYSWTRLSILSLYTKILNDTDTRELDAPVGLGRFKEVLMLDLKLVNVSCLDVAGDGDDDRDPDDVRGLGFAKCSREAINMHLQELLSETYRGRVRSLHFHCLDRHKVKPSVIFNTRKWPNLAFLSLDSLSFHLASFEIFLSCQMDSLQELRLSDMPLDVSVGRQITWVYFLEFIRDTLRLSGFMLRRIVFYNGPSDSDFYGHPNIGLGSGGSVDLGRLH